MSIDNDELKKQSQQALGHVTLQPTYTNSDGVTGNLGPGPCPTGPSNNEGTHKPTSKSLGPTGPSSSHRGPSGMEFKNNQGFTYNPTCALCGQSLSGHTSFGTWYSEKIDDTTALVDLSFDSKVNIDDIEMGPSNPYVKDVLDELENQAEKEKEERHFKKQLKEKFSFNVSEDRPGLVLDKNKNCVLQDWVLYLNYKMQSALISAVRGYDNDFDDNKTDLKNVVRMLRHLILKNADGNNNFMTKYCIPEEVIVKTLITHLEDCFNNDKSIHWIEHIYSAINIIMNYHHNSYVQHFWLNIAKKMNEEVEEMITYRVNVFNK